MKKSSFLYTLAGFVVLASACSPSQKKTDLEIAGLNGPVKQVTELTLSHISDSLSTDADPAEEQVEYDVMKVLDFYPNGMLKSARIILPSETIVHKYIYDEKDSLQLNELQVFVEGGLAFRESYRYNAKGQRQIAVRKDTDDKTLLSEEYTYDRKGNRVEQKNTYPDGGTKKIMFTYDPKGRPVGKREFQNGVDSKIAEKSTYNDRGDMVEKAVTDNLFESHTVTEKYSYPQSDSLGNWIQMEARGFNQEQDPSGILFMKRERNIEYYK